MLAYLSDSLAGSKAKVNIDDNGQPLQRGLEEPFSEFIDDCFSYIEDIFELDQPLSSKLMPSKIDNDEVDTSLSSSSPAEHMTRLGAPIILSPASPTSSSPSPNRSSSVWESPQTPLPKSDQVDFDLSTPLTPIDTSYRTSKARSYTDKENQTSPSNATHESCQVHTDSGKNVRRNLRSDFQAIRKSVFNKSSAAVDKNVDISPIKLESTSADANDNLDSHNTEVQIKVEDSQVTLEVDLKPKSLKVLSQSNQSASGAALSATDVCDQILQTATVTKNDGSDGFQIFQKNFITPSHLEEHGSHKVFSDFQSDAKDNIATSLILGKHNITFDFSTNAEVQTGSADRRNCKIVTAKSQDKNGSSGLKSSPVVISQPEKRITGLKEVLKHIIPFEVRDRLNDHPHECIASYSRKLVRCTNKVFSPSGVPAPDMTSMVACVQNHDYIALPDIIENFLAGAVCDLHRRVALSQPKANPRMNVLRDLVVSWPKVSERNIGIFEEWLEAIVDHSLPSLTVNPGGQCPQTTRSSGLPAILDQITPQRMRSRVKKHPKRCVVSACGLSRGTAGGHRLQNKHSTIDAMTKLIADCAKGSTYTDLVDQFESLARVVMCRKHHENAMSRLKIFKALISNLPHVSNQHLSDLRTWLTAITNCDLPSFPQIATIPALSASRRSKNLVTRNATYAVNGNVTPSYSPKFNPYKAERSDSSSIAEALQAQIVVPLSETDKKEGLVYIFWDQQNFGMIKVGRTNDLDKRLEQWSRQCKMTYHYHQSSRNGSLLKVPHVQRIEKLVHIELVNYRKKRRCEGCGKTHIEWFDIDEAKAVKVYQKWRDWIVKEPYAEDQTGKWTIRPEMLDTLTKVCEPVVFEKTKKESPQLRRRSAQLVMKRQEARKLT